MSLGVILEVGCHRQNWWKIAFLRTSHLGWFSVQMAFGVFGNDFSLCISLLMFWSLNPNSFYNFRYIISADATFDYLEER